MSGNLTVKKFNVGGYLVLQSPYSFYVTVFNPQGKIIYTERRNGKYTQYKAERLIRELTSGEQFLRF